MKQLSVTYKAPPGGSKVVEMFGHTFFDGKAETVTVDERQSAKLKGNSYFSCGEEKDVDPKPAEQDAKAAEAEDQAKLAAQGTSPPLRGAQINPPKDVEDVPEPEDGKAVSKPHTFQKEDQKENHKHGR